MGVGIFGFTASSALVTFRTICLAAVARACSERKPTLYFDWNLLLQVGIYFVFMGIPCLGFEPSTVVRTSFSQPYGPCRDTETSFWGMFIRGKNVCLSNISATRDHYDFH